MLYLVCTALDFVARRLRALAEYLETAANRLSFCPDCGRNRYYGPPCKNL